MRRERSPRSAAPHAGRRGPAGRDSGLHHRKWRLRACHSRSSVLVRQRCRGLRREPQWRPDAPEQAWVLLLAPAVRCSRVGCHLMAGHGCLHGSGAAHRFTSLTRGLRVCTAALTSCRMSMTGRGQRSGAEAQCVASASAPAFCVRLGREYATGSVLSFGFMARESSVLGGAAQASAGRAAHIGRAGWFR